MPAAFRITAKAPGFSGQARISPALWISRTSAPSTSHGVLTSMPVFSVMSSSMNSMLSLTTAAFMPVEEPTLSWSIEPLSWSSFGGDAHLLAEELAEFVGDQAVVDADRAGLRAAPAEVAAVGQLDQARDQRPVELDVAVLPGREQAAVLDVLEVEAAQDLGAVGRPVELVAAAGLVDVAGVGAGLALRAVLHGEQQRLQEGPVVLAW